MFFLIPKGINLNGVSATYKSNMCSRVCKDSFVQFGNLLFGPSSDLQPLEDESYQLKNDTPGVLGMIR